MSTCLFFSHSLLRVGTFHVSIGPCVNGRRWSGVTSFAIILNFTRPRRVCWCAATQRSLPSALPPVRRLVARIFKSRATLYNTARNSLSGTSATYTVCCWPWPLLLCYCDYLSVTRGRSGRKVIYGFRRGVFVPTRSVCAGVRASSTYTYEQLVLCAGKKKSKKNDRNFVYYEPKDGKATLL